ncbi:RRQRL motif-containing zinc-binding protein [Streptomyces spongiicola]|uniref:RRQRL motif-containing zinc-binding protein n=1 Tax=Streptomyces spongiicola TaxID=1690221 RepID=UPI0026BB93CA|nr:RRQRL motif-containing zinc-binding protein [Streptomyces spongiicola]
MTRAGAATVGFDVSIRAGSVPRRHRGPLVAYLYRIDRAEPMRPMTAARWAAFAKANAARRKCPECGRDAGYVIPSLLGACVPCAYPEQPEAA